MRTVKKHSFIIIVLIFFEGALLGLAFAGQGPNQSHIKILGPGKTSFVLPRSVLTSPDLMNHVTSGEGAFFSSLKFPVPQGIHLSLEPTRQPDGSRSATHCPDGSSVPTECPDSNLASFCPSADDNGGRIVPTICPLIGKNKSNKLLARFATVCVFEEDSDGHPAIYATYCYNQGGPETEVATTCRLHDEVRPTYCEHEEGPNVEVQTFCPNEMTIPTYCQYVRDEYGFPKISPTHCLNDKKSDGSPIFIITLCPDEYHSTECPDNTWVATQCHQDGLPPIVTTHCPDTESPPTTCPDAERNPTFCINGQNDCNF